MILTQVLISLFTLIDDSLLMLINRIMNYYTLLAYMIICLMFHSYCSTSPIGN